jgi:hypothetical protein
MANVAKSVAIVLVTLAVVYRVQAIRSVVLGA